VGAVSGFGKVGGAIWIYDIACNSLGCYESTSGSGGATSSGVELLAHGTGSPTALPDGKRLASVVTVGTTVYGEAYEGTSGSYLASVYKLLLGTTTWIRVGTPQPLSGMQLQSLETDGLRLFRSATSGLSAIPVGAGPDDPWSPVGAGFQGRAYHERVDSAGNLYAMGSAPTMAYKLPVGQSAWVALPLGASAMAQDSYSRFGGRRLTLAPNDDLWMVGANFVTKLPAGSTTWQRIFTGPSPFNVSEDNVSEIIVDGSNTAYFTFGQTTPELYKVAPGASTATDTGVAIPSAAPTRPCTTLGIDANGKLLVTAFGGFAVSGLFRSTP
jgi:hypothetical protein